MSKSHNKENRVSLRVTAIPWNPMDTSPPAGGQQEPARDGDGSPGDHDHQSSEQTVCSSVEVQQPPEMETPDDLLRAADDALYMAKDSGRNMVCRASERPQEGSEESTTETFGQPAALPTTLDQPGRILVVDDDASTRTLCKTFLER